MPVQPELAYSDPVIKRGSILMSRPGTEFAFHQQYFHKAIILVIDHQANRDIGLILNRPTGIVTTQLGIEGPPWRLMFGGDCDSLSTYGAFSEAAFYCLHTLDKFAGLSREVIRGVYLMSPAKGRELVLQGAASTADFFLVVGYCGWGSGQLQQELNRGDIWKMATVDSRIIIRELAEEALELRSLPRLGLDDGIGVWRRVYAAVDSGSPEAVQQEDMFGDGLADQKLREWVGAALGGGQQESPNEQLDTEEMLRLQALLMRQLVGEE